MTSNHEKKYRLDSLYVATTQMKAWRKCAGS